MGYSLHIERLESPIELEEWREAVSLTKGVRIVAESTYTAENPQTGEAIGISASPGDAEIYDVDDEQWHPAILWREDRGSGTLNAQVIAGALSFGDLSDPGWQAISNLAKVLKARIRGDEGEEYDLDTAKSK